MRHPRIEETAEPFDEAEHFELALAGSRDGAVDGGVECRRVAAGGENPDPLHVWTLR